MIVYQNMLAGVRQSYETCSSSLLVSTLAGASFAVAQTLKRFLDKAEVAEVGDEEAQMEVASAYEQGVKPTQRISSRRRGGTGSRLKGNIEVEFRLPGW
jgi:hypothetical protein